MERRLPFLELALGHPDLEPTQVGGSFFADALPYEAGGERRVFYWRFRLPPRCESPDRWEGICATPHRLIPLPTDRHIGDEFIDRGDRGVRLPVEATVAGESLDALVESYDPPSIHVLRLDPDRADIDIDGAYVSVTAGERREVSLSSRTVTLASASSDDAFDPEDRTVEPRLTIRYPGLRHLSHPGSERYALFPSFGLDLDSLPRRTDVPLVDGQLDEEGLADSLGVELAQLSLAERVLWRAFAHVGFGPHSSAEGTPRLTQFDSGHIGLFTDEHVGAVQQQNING